MRLLHTFKIVGGKGTLHNRQKEKTGSTCEIDGLIMKDATQPSSGISARSEAKGSSQVPEGEVIVMMRMKRSEAKERMTVPSGCGLQLVSK